MSPEKYVDNKKVDEITAMLFKEADGDKDDQISLEEFYGEMKEEDEKLELGEDQDNDVNDEPELGDDIASEMFKAFDTDANGQLSRTEAKQFALSQVKELITPG